MSALEDFRNVAVTRYQQIPTEEHLKKLIEEHIEDDDVYVFILSDGSTYAYSNLIENEGRWSCCVCEEFRLRGYCRHGDEIFGSTCIWDESSGVYLPNEKQVDSVRMAKILYNVDGEAIVYEENPEEDDDPWGDDDDYF